MRNIQGNRQSGKDRGSTGLFTNILSSPPSKSRLYDTNIGNLKVVIEYFASLRNKGKLNDKEFSALITQLCADFIENKMASVLNKVLVKASKGIFEEYMNEW
ncbi:MAG: hypothetical protein GTO45_09955 [Candidatus Aminicenantes bacterium]|nr:hypothetical protein [Candidatus Aminicenantes bacterium]NIM79132.1 hypothetical protein [Candidatus Aminicenantes bacterium]NIN18417.1 hypothetical protein [Candidatus Aminicenantes bacterium]NIN42305.1 hypothetical protein [Candidatus Aminicenantes bacterium]NIN85071.1 hypothetical protein [Candidatus Aminicenantes bacterium]